MGSQIIISIGKFRQFSQVTFVKLVSLNGKGILDNVIVELL
jgi:hypothetical protein